VRTGAPRPAPNGPNQEWALDFVHDAAESGQKFRTLSVLDVYTREALVLEVDTSMGSRRVTRMLEQILAERGKPALIRCDNGPEFTSRHFLAWCLEREIELVHIEPGKPVQNAHVESFHGQLREECLNASWFGNLFEARRKIGAWRKEYNEERPHSSLGYRTPEEFAANYAAVALAVGSATMVVARQTPEPLGRETGTEIEGCIMSPSVGASRGQGVVWSCAERGGTSSAFSRRTEKSGLMARRDLCQWERIIIAGPGDEFLPRYEQQGERPSQHKRR